MAKRRVWMLLVMGLVACGGDEPAEGTATDGLGSDDLCAAEVACTGVDVATCETVRGAQQQEAVEAGCDAELTLYWSCLLQSASCDNGAWTAPACDAEELAATVCIDGPPTDTTPITVTDPPRISRLQVDCPTPRTARLTVTAAGADGDEVIVDVVSTGEPAHRYEAHRLPNVGGATYEVLLDSDASYTEGVATALSCVKGVHYYASREVMTYVVRAYDPLGLADCVADGAHPEGVLAGDYPDYGNGIDEVNVSDLVCEVGELGPL